MPPDSVGGVLNLNTHEFVTNSNFSFDRSKKLHESSYRNMSLVNVTEPPVSAYRDRSVDEPVRKSISDSTISVQKETK